MRIVTTIILVTISISLYAQLGKDMPGYTPMTAKLLSLNHKVNCNTVKYEKISVDNLNLNSNKEDINIYINYEMDVGVVKNNQKGYFTIYTLPEKLMDLDIIYSYHYKIPYVSLSELNSLMPSIELENDYQVESIKASNVYSEKGKVKSKKINKNQIKIDTTSNTLKISFENGTFKNKSIIEFFIEIKSQYFNSLNPTFNTSDSFERQLTISMPFILDYNYPSNSSKFNLKSEETKPIQLLQLHRKNRDWDNVVDIFEMNFTSYTWEVKSNIDTIPNNIFKLQELRIPFDIDIGVPRTELFKLSD